MKVPWDGDLVDGGLFQYLSQDSAELLGFAHQVLSYAGNNFPIFVILPSTLNSGFRSALAQLQGAIKNLLIFEKGMSHLVEPLEASAEQASL